MNFPPNPENGMIFESSPGQYYQYHSNSKSWKKLEGYGNIPLASASSDGLMSKDDYTKLQSLIIPPPRTTLTSDQCNTIFKEGQVTFVSSNDDLKIKTALDLHTKTDVVDEDFIIHDNTHGIDFTVNLDRLIEELNKRGNIIYRSTKGNRGPKGDRGDPGRDYLDTGPQGDPGINGKNAPYPGTLEQDFSEVEFSGKVKKAIVNIRNDEEDPKKLIVTMGNIGNPFACPNRVKWQNRSSPWLLCTNDAPLGCSFGEGECARQVCTTDLHYIDVTDILQMINDRYEVIMNNIKIEKEQLVKEWLTTLISMFSAQKSALCCAIESLKSKRKNQEIRDAWSNSRYSAAQAGYSFTVSDGRNETKYPKVIPHRTPSDYYPPNQSHIPHQQVKIAPGTSSAFDCDGCYGEITLDYTNVGSQNAIKFEFDSGKYTATIIQCCASYANIGSTGVFNLSFNSDSATQTYRLNDKGFFIGSAAEANYVGDSIAFKHDGGVIAMYLDSVITLGVSGKVVICIQPNHCFDNCPESGTSGTDLTNLTDPSAIMKASHLEFYERGWRVGNCCGAYLTVMGQKFIVVYRSIGTDMSCGGGEYSDTPAIAYFNSIFKKQIAIAWPTYDGDSFFGLPRNDGSSEIELIYDQTISEAIVSAIRLNNVHLKKGHPETVITHVVLPMVSV
jgi:hypothetical protein